MRVRPGSRLGMLVAAAVAVVSVTGCGGDSEGAGAAVGESGETVKIRMASTVPEGTATGDGATRIVDELNKGSFEVQAFMGSTLYGQEDLGEAVESGDVHIGINASDWWSDVEPAASLQNLPLLWDNERDLQETVTGPAGEELKKLLDRHGVKTIGFLIYGPADTYGTTDKKVTKPADLQGLKIRSYDTLINTMLESYGASPVIIDSSEVYPALQQGTIDGVLSSAVSYTAQNWQEVVKYAAVMPQGWAIYPVVANAEWWEQQSPAIQDELTETVATESQWVADQTSSYIEEAHQTLADAGVEVTFIPEEEQAAWIEPAKVVYDEYYKVAGEEGRKLVEMVESSRD